MFESIGTFIDNLWAGLFAFNPLDPWSAGVYFLPLVVCGASYVVETLSDLAADAKDLKKFNDGTTSSYQPKTTIGTVLARIFLSFTPIVNMICMIFTRIESIVKLFMRTFDMPIMGRPKHRTSKEQEAFNAAKNSNIKVLPVQQRN